MWKWIVHQKIKQGTLGYTEEWLHEMNVAIARVHCAHMHENQLQMDGLCTLFVIKLKLKDVSKLLRRGRVISLDITAPKLGIRQHSFSTAIVVNHGKISAFARSNLVRCVGDT